MVYEIGGHQDLDSILNFFRKNIHVDILIIVIGVFKLSNINTE